MSFSVNFSNSLDNHITGHFGEDQYNPLCDDCDLDCEHEIPANCPLYKKDDAATIADRNEESLYELEEETIELKEQDTVTDGDVKSAIDSIILCTTPECPFCEEDEAEKRIK
jgi:hypothetical protein